MEIIFATTAAQIAVAPLIAYSMGTFSVTALLTNLLVIWLIPAIMVVGVMGGILAFIWPLLGQLVSLFNWFASSYIFKVSHWFASLSWSQIFINLAAWQALLTYLMFFLGVWRLHRKFLIHRHGV